MGTLAMAERRDGRQCTEPTAVSPSLAGARRDQDQPFWTRSEDWDGREEEEQVERRKPLGPVSVCGRESSAPD